MRLLSPAKVNLHLRIGPTAADGFHPIMSWFCTVGLFDSIEIAPPENQQISLTCNWKEIPTDEKNLVVRAAKALLERAGEMRGAKIHLGKQIPAGGGLGGGSSDAATTLRGLNEFWNLKLPVLELAKIAETLGSDVPFFLHGPSSVCTGRGQFVSPISPPKPHSAVLMFPNISVATPGVYRQFDLMKLGSPDAINVQPDWKKWTALPAHDLLPLLVNDLEKPAFAICPEVGNLRDKIEQYLGRIVRMTGSGSTLFTLADEHLEAEEIARLMSERIIPAQAVELCPSTAV